MYPYGSGYPPNNNAPYPPNPAYPPNPGYPTQQAPYPNASPFPGGAPFGAGYPQNPNTPAYGINPPQGGSPYPPGGNSAYPLTGNSAYPPTGGSAYPPTSSPYPPANPPYQQTPSQYPTQNQSVPQYGAGYPPSQSQQPPYPGAGGAYGAPQYPPSSTNTTAPYPGHQQNPSPYPQQGGGQGGAQPYGYHGEQQQSATNMAQCFTEMKGHVQTIRTENTKKKQAEPSRHLTKPVPALKPTFHFDPEADAGNLRRAMEGLGTEDKILINILCHRSNEQRQLIQQVYKSPYGRGLIEDVKAKTGGNFEKVLVALLLPPWEYRVKVLHDAFTGIGIDEEALIEFLCTYTNREIQTLSQLYQKNYKKTLEHDIMAHAPDHMKHLMLAAVHGKREEDHTVDQELARSEADMLVQAFKLGTDESAFNIVFSRRNHDQIRCTDEEYKKITGHTLEEAIENEFTGCIKDALLAILQYSHNRYEYFASRLHKSMVGFGTNDKHLMRVIVSRSEIDLINIKNAFEQKYGKSLKSWIKGDTSGDYKQCLLALIQEA